MSPPSPSKSGRLLVWVGNNPLAEPLVQHASRLAAIDGLPWTVITVDTPGTLNDAPGQRVHALRALELAERLGADTDSLSGDSVLAVVARRARADGVTAVLIGGRESEALFDRWQSHWIGTLADALGSRLPGVTIHTMTVPGRQAAAGDSTRRDAADAPPRQRWLRALAVVALCTVISDFLVSKFELANVAMVYLAGVVVVALRYGQAASLMAVLASIAVFDLIFVPPRWGFKPTDPQYFFTFTVMLVVGMLITRLVAQARLQALLAQARARRAHALSQLARQLASARSVQEVAQCVVAAIDITFGVGACVLAPDAAGALQAVAAEPAALGLDMQAATQVFAQARGDAMEEDPADHAELSYLPLRGAGATLGVLVAERLPAAFGAPEDRHLLHAFADQAALALQRCHYERRSAESAVEAETERLRNTLLSGISHDFRTPLTTIVGAATTLIEQGALLDAHRRTMLLHSVLDEAARMHTLTSGLLDLTRMEEGAVQLSCEWCPADELVEEALAGLRSRLQGHVLHVEVSPDTVVWGDPRLIEQVLANLVDNALRHTRRPCTVNIAIEVQDHGWELSVSDDGPGLPAGQEAEVFKRFVRGRGEPSGTGTGLGLAICAAVARLHHGTITAANRAQGGACFTLRLPQPAAGAIAMEQAA